MSPIHVVTFAAALACLATPSCRPRERALLGQPSQPGQPGQPGAPSRTLDALAPNVSPQARPAGACGRLAGEPIVPKQDHDNPSIPECNQAATVWGNVAHEDLACRTNADCVALGGGSGGCFSSALNRTGAAKPEYQARPCGNPAAGACMARAVSVYCGEGCCLVQ